jgi:hypothetical protein
MTMTCGYNRLPSGVTKDYLHFKKTPADDHSSVAQFNQRITAVKQVLFDINDMTRMPFK